MALSNLENRVKQDSAYPRTSQDAILRSAKNIKIVEDEVTGLTIEVDKKVNSNEIITKINASPEQVAIQANKVSLAGKTIALTGDNINISGTNFSVDSSGNMTCNSATMNNATINNTAIVNGSKFSVSSGGSLSCSDITITGGNVTIPDGLNKGIEVHADSNSNHYFTRQRAGAFSCYRNNVLMGRIMDGSSNIGGVLQLYNTSGTMTIQADGTDGNVQCVSLTQTSEAEKKKNFEKLDNALDILKEIDIYKYNLKTENDTDKKHIGFVIGEDYKYREEITDIDNKGVDLYSFISVCCKAVQEQQEEIEELRKLVNK